jgi:hypothetical protein
MVKWLHVVEHLFCNIIISCFRDLSGCDVGSACDTVVTILCSSISSDWKQCGKTIEMSDDNFPVWPELFTFEYIQSEHLVGFLSMPNNTQL